MLGISLFWRAVLNKVSASGGSVPGDTQPGFTTGALSGDHSFPLVGYLGIGVAVSFTSGLSGISTLVIAYV